MKPSHTPEETAAVPVKDRVLATLEAENITPRSKYVFWCQNWLVWGLWSVSGLLGGVAVAVMAFASTHQYYALYEATHENYVTFILGVLPFLWIGLFVGMVLLAAWQLKHTKRGYRLSTPALAVSSVVCSLVLGALFHNGGFAWELDMKLGELAPMYVSQAEREQETWQNPAAGRLVGYQLPSAGQATVTVAFRDMAGTDWVVWVRDLSAADQQFLRDSNQVRLLGAPVSLADNTFHACGVFAWMLGGHMTAAQFDKERKDFVDRMYTHYENAEARKQAINTELAEAVADTPADSPCHQLAAVRRVHEQFQH